MRLLLNSRQKVVGFWLVITVEGCSLSPAWALLGDNGGAHGTTPVKPIGRPWLAFISLCVLRPSFLPLPYSHPPLHAAPPSICPSPTLPAASPLPAISQLGRLASNLVQTTTADLRQASHHSPNRKSSWRTLSDMTRRYACAEPGRS